MIRDYNDVHVDLPERSPRVTSPSSSLRALRSVLGTLAPGRDWEQRTQQSVRLRQLLEKNLPSPLAAACQAWLEDEGVLVLACSNGAVAAKLKQLLPRLLQVFRSAEGQISSIRVEVQGNPAAPSSALTAGKRRSHRVIPPPGVAAGLEAAADRMKESGLGDAMRRLAVRLRGSGPG